LDRFFTRLATRLLHEDSESQGSSSRGARVSSACLAEHVDTLKVFGDIPRRLSSLVRRSFIVARNFVRGLVVGQDTIAALANVSVLHMGNTQGCSGIGMPIKQLVNICYVTV